MKAINPYAPARAMLLDAVGERLHSVEPFFVSASV
jgi:hypothetical protein